VLSSIGALALYRVSRRVEDATWALLASPNDPVAIDEHRDALSRLYGQIDALTDDLGGWSRKLRPKGPNEAPKVLEGAAAAAIATLDQARAQAGRRTYSATSRPASKSSNRAT
jgi:hypothetical protein